MAAINIEQHAMSPCINAHGRISYSNYCDAVLSVMGGQGRMKTFKKKMNYVFDQTELYLELTLPPNAHWEADISMPILIHSKHLHSQ